MGRATVTSATSAPSFRNLATRSSARGETSEPSAPIRIRGATLPSPPRSRKYASRTHRLRTDRRPDAGRQGRKRRLLLRPAGAVRRDRRGSDGSDGGGRQPLDHDRDGEQGRTRDLRRDRRAAREREAERRLDRHVELLRRRRFCVRPRRRTDAVLPDVVRNERQVPRADGAADDRQIHDPDRPAVDCDRLGDGDALRRPARHQRCALPIRPTCQQPYSARSGSADRRGSFRRARGS